MPQRQSSRGPFQLRTSSSILIHSIIGQLLIGAQSVVGAGVAGVILAAGLAVAALSLSKRIAPDESSHKTKQKANTLKLARDGFTYISHKTQMD
ncbi:hypothetical protein Syun_025599 [Stephania yunnanensis]|uniref:Uncharacterized protein n=1 Tax=Stephania yunnanensis TaxID=152371 RepID=A0AAP0ESF9_9MAGN